MADAFDLVVHRKDSKGRVVEVNPYRMLVVEGRARFERPVGSGNWYHADGTVIVIGTPEEEFSPEFKAKKKAAEAREALKAELRAEIEAEQVALAAPAADPIATATKPTFKKG